MKVRTETEIIVIVSQKLKQIVLQLFKGLNDNKIGHHLIFSA